MIAVFTVTISRGEMMMNPNCDGGKCISSTGEVRVLPTGGSSNAILCWHCFMREIRFREQRNRELAGANKFDLPTWASLKKYDAS